MADAERYELVEGTSSKFWEASVEGAVLTVRFGRIGTQGQSKDKAFSDAAAAVKEKDKLVREKTGKGYARVDAGAQAPDAAPASAPVRTDGAPTPEASAPVATQAPPDEAPEPAATGTPDAVPRSTGLLARGEPLPSRTRPAPLVGAEDAWSRHRALLTGLLPAASERNAQAAGHFADRLPETAPGPFAAPEIVAWMNNLALVANASLPYGWQKQSPEGAAARDCIAHFAQWVARSAGTAVLIAAADGLRPDFGKPWQAEVGWVEYIDVALRLALTQAPEAEYAEAVAFAEAVCAQDADERLALYYAYILGDDRPQPSRFDALSVLRAAAASAHTQVAHKQIGYAGLVADAQPSQVLPLWSTTTETFHVSRCCVSPGEMAATVTAVARRHGESPVPALEWLLSHAFDELRVPLAEALYETGEDAGFAVLLPLLHEKPIRKAFDAACAAYPGWMFQRCLAALSSGRFEPALAGRVADLIGQHGLEAARAWAAGLGGKGATWFDRHLAARASRLAPPEACPTVLRDPPWRRKQVKSDDLVLALEPLPTPFAYDPDVVRRPEYLYRTNRAHVVDTLDALPAVIAEIEAKPRSSYFQVPPPDRPPPEAGASPQACLDWLAGRLAQIARVRFALYAGNYEDLYRGLEKQAEPLALMLWEASGPLVAAASAAHFPDSVPGMLARFRERALPGLVGLVESDPLTALPLALGVDAAGLAPPAARALFKLKKARQPAIAWLRRHRATAIGRLIPDALGKPGAVRDAAEHALRWFAADREDGREAVEAGAAAYARAEPGVAEALDRALVQVLDRDPLGRVPAKVGKLSAWVQPGALARPQLRDGAGGLPDEAIGAFAEMLSFTPTDELYGGIPLMREACTPDSLGAFAWDLFSAWIAAGAPAKDGWALRAVGWLGNDACARDLTRLIRRWPGEAAHARAVTGLDVLVDIGSDVALMNLNGIAEKLKFKGLQEKAREKIAQLAEARGLSPEELSDRLAPDLDLDERGGLDLDFGERRFRAGFDEALKPWVKDEAGKRLKDLPKPIKSDDAEKSAAASARWSALKKDARAVASLQIARLEAMLASSRRVRPDVFRLFFAAHPLVRHLTQRLVWAVFPDDDPRSLPTASFRVAEDLSFTDAGDEPAAIDVSEQAPGLIGLLHPLHAPDGLEAWGALFGDYEIAQPFPQLGRETYALDEAEKPASSSKRFEGVVVEAKRLRGMPARGWRLGDPQDGGVVAWIERMVAFPDGSARTIYLGFEGGLFSGASEFEDREQTLREMGIEHPWHARGQGGEPALGMLDAVTASELLRGPSLLAATRLR